MKAKTSHHVFLARPPGRCVLTFMLLLLIGCSPTKPDANPSPVESLADAKLRLLVVGDAEMAEAAGRLRGEWNAQTGGLFEVESIAAARFNPTAPLAADAVILASHALGPLAENGLIRPLADQTLQDNLAEWQDVFEMLRRSEAAWIDRPMGVPFGSPVLTLYYRPDLLEQLGRRPPETWDEYRELAELLADRGNLADAAPPAGSPWRGAIEPLGPGWAGVVLLARAAPYAKHRDDYSTLFDLRTMEPLVAGPPFVRALEELVAIARIGMPQTEGKSGSRLSGATAGLSSGVFSENAHGTAGQASSGTLYQQAASATRDAGSLDAGLIAALQYDPADARAAFRRGECGMALGWPSAAGESADEREPLVETAFAALPGSTRVFNRRKETWESRADDEDPRVPLVAIAGRIGVVGRESPNAEAAWKLLFWLSGKSFGARVSAASAATTLSRQSQLAEPAAWVERSAGRAAAAQYAATAQATFSSDQWIFAPRIPGRAAYLAALDEAVRRAVIGEQSPTDALDEAAAQWREITQRMGIEKQRTAYCHSLGLQP